MREKLAELIHDRWSGWIRHVKSKSTLNPDGSMTIPAWAVSRRERQMKGSYNDLSEEEKDSDRREADKVLALIEKCIWEHAPGSLVDLPLFQSHYEKQEPIVAFNEGCTSALVNEKTERLAEVIDEARHGISNRPDEIPLDVITRWLAYIEGDTVAADILQCHGCGKPSSSLTTWTIEDDDGNSTILWLCSRCMTVATVDAEPWGVHSREDTDCEEE